MKGKEKRDRSGRILEFDLLRGIAVILMMLDHLLYDIFSVMPMFFSDYPGKNPTALALCRAARVYWYHPVREGTRVAVIAVFLLLSGICCHFSKNNAKRGGRLMFLALCITLVSFFIGCFTGDIDFMISFGILHCIALMLLLVGLFQRIGLNRWFFLALGVALNAVGIFFNADLRYVSYESRPFLETLWGQMVGKMYAGSDSCALTLFGGPILIGVFLGETFYKERRSLIFSRYREGIVTKIGRNSLLFYVLHQALLPLLLGGILLLCGFHIGV